jgi:ABC-2 type transport system ATP-binding protein
VSATLPDGSRDHALAVLRATGGVRGVEERGSRVVVTASDSDGVARLLLGELGGSDLEIVTAGLEQAFMALTGDDRERPDGHPDNQPAHPDEELVR